MMYKMFNEDGSYNQFFKEAIQELSIFENILLDITRVYKAGRPKNFAYYLTSTSRAYPLIQKKIIKSIDEYKEEIQKLVSKYNSNNTMDIYEGLKKDMIKKGILTSRGSVSPDYTNYPRLVLTTNLLR